MIAFWVKFKNPAHFALVPELQLPKSLKNLRCNSDSFMVCNCYNRVQLCYQLSGWSQVRKCDITPGIAC